MLTNLHVKNIALIDEAEIEFEPGFNALTGETGAGKSILLGSVDLALGGKYSAELLHDPEKPGLCELTFEPESEETVRALAALDIAPEDGRIVISRKCTGKKSTLRINGETVSLSRAREAAAQLIDIHGQRDSQTLLTRRNQLKLVDSFGDMRLAALRARMKTAWKKERDLERELLALTSRGENRAREMSFLAYEIEEVESAGLIPGEDEALEHTYRRMLNGKKIAENLFATYQATGYDSREGCGSRIGEALRRMQEIEAFDPPLGELTEQLLTIDSLLNDFNRELSDYAQSAEFSEAEFQETEARLNELNRLKEKYGMDIDGILATQEERCRELETLRAFDETVEKLRIGLEEAKRETLQTARELSAARKETAKKLAGKIRDNLLDLNFLRVQFEIAFTGLETPGEAGMDDVEFCISMNPGEPLKPLSRIASGGELSRIMLAVKSVLADRDDTETLIFDEIDAGISGRTAQKIAEKIAALARKRQIICITHLAQIASMADTHYRIEKTSDQKRTWTSVEKLGQEESVRELARIMGGAQITDTVLEGAAEMKRLAKKQKEMGE